MGTGIRKKHLPTAICGQSPKTAQSETGRFWNWKFCHVKSIMHGVPSRRRPPSALHQIGQIRKGDQKNHLPILRQLKNTIAPRLWRYYGIVRRWSDLRFGETRNRFVCKFKCFFFGGGSNAKIILRSGSNLQFCDWRCLRGCLQSVSWMGSDVSASAKA